MKCSYLRDFIIIPALEFVDLYSEAAVNLLLGTAAQESHMGHYLYQISGPAIGLYQIEPATHKSVLEDYVAYRPTRQFELDEWSIGKNPAENLLASPHYQTLIARFKYRQVAELFPDHNDIKGLARYWKKYYNTYLGRGREEEFIENYKRYVIQ